jgi:hypothetical protein
MGKKHNLNLSRFEASSFPSVVEADLFVSSRELLQVRSTPDVDFSQ